MSRYPNQVKVPYDKDFLKRPFFAYGIFKRGQLSHSRIRDCIDEIEPYEVNRKMRIKDGVPLIVNQESTKITKGQKISFLEDKRVDAYEAISATEPDTIFGWDTIDVGGDECNVLVGKHYGGTIGHVDGGGNYLDDFDGSNDPFFNKVPKFICEELEKLESDDDESIFKFQMYYMLLWTAIDRYCALKYEFSTSQGDILEQFYKDELFKQAVQELELEERGKIRSARDGGVFYYDLDRMDYVANFYYTIRSNVVHRGKEQNNKMNELKRSLNDLLDIFDLVIKKSFNENEI